MHFAWAQCIHKLLALVEGERAQVGLVAHHVRGKEHQQVVLLLVGRSAGEQISQYRNIRNPRHSLALDVIVVRHQAPDHGGPMVLHQDRT